MLENDLTPITKPATVFLKDYTPPRFLVPTVTMHVDLNDAKALIKTTLLIKRNGEHSEDLRLDGEKTTLISLKLNGQTLANNDYELNSDSLHIATSLDEFELEVVTQSEPKLNTELTGLYQSSGNFCTQCEAEGFRRITYFPDRPDVLSEYTVTVSANKKTCPVILSNGNLIDQGEESDSHWATWHDPHPKPSYLFALVAGDLQNISSDFETQSGQKVELNIYTQAHNIEKCQHAMDSLINSMRWDEKVYGREYDLSVYNIVAVDDFNMGAMENKGLNIFNSKYVLADQASATDTDFEGIESVIGHEYFHNWSGNRVTCRDWFQLSLKEGFTVFRDQEFSADMASRGVKRIKDVQVLRAFQFKEDAGPMAHPIRPDSYQEINNFYTVTVYNKGAEVIRMLRCLLGEQGFRKGTDLYFDRYDGQAVTTEDFVQSLEEANNADLKQFRNWYTQSGTPNVDVTTRFSKTDEDNNTGTFSIELTQSCPATPGQEHKEPFVIPIKVALFYKNGEKVLEETLILTQATECFNFEGLSEKPVLSILRDFSAPIKLSIERTTDELKNLVRLDDNGFACWEAMQELSLNVLLPAIETGQLSDSAYGVLISAFKDLIASNPDDKAIFAEMLNLPSATYIAGLTNPIEPQKVVQIREQCITRLAKDLESEFHSLYAQHNVKTEFSLSSDAMAGRALKNRALFYLVATGQAAYHALASNQYHTANNMTDRLAAFTALTHSSYPEREMLVEDFYESWKDQALVLDKWLAIQSMRPHDSTLAEVKALCQHPSFSFNNPNKVYSLIGAFSSNLVSFHQPQGESYAFFADKVIELNSVNPQLAARLVGTFNNWRMYAEPYKSQMRSQLERIRAVENLAKNVSEIVTKALD